MRTNRTVPAALLGLTLLMAACGDTAGSSALSASTAGPSHASMSMSMAPGPRPSTAATVAIVSPKNGETVRASAVALKISLDGGSISTTTSTDLVPDEGHLHIVLDDRLISMTSGLASVIPDVTPGTHLLKVEFVANDHAPFDPRVIAAVSFEVRA
ncbi:MAG: hypothetical protein ABI572_06530 [Actinomycetota bacterium]